VLRGAKTLAIVRPSTWPAACGVKLTYEVGFS
jgi:hypothetical protein